MPSRELPGWEGGPGGCREPAATHGTGSQAVSVSEDPELSGTLG